MTADPFLAPCDHSKLRDEHMQPIYKFAYECSVCRDVIVAKAFQDGAKDMQFRAANLARRRFSSAVIQCRIIADEMEALPLEPPAVEIAARRRT